ncbi:MAG: NUDIX domain-containing protein [Anaerococcus sp.]|nr:NUDIX domain-containing protein [Anaerococcus sp.]
MKTRLMNMLMIEDKGKFLILDKVKKEGWEGLTFPGGKVMDGESISSSVRREAKEETNLDIGEITFVGIISWVYEDKRDLGFLYKTNDFKGDLIKENREGKLFWDGYERMKKMDGLSASMTEIFKIYDGIYKEITYYLDRGEIKRE